MPDPRFFEDLGPVTLADLAALTGAALADPAAGGAAGRARSRSWPARPPTRVTFVSDRKFLGQVRETKAGACFVTAERRRGPRRRAAPPW